MKGLRKQLLPIKTFVPIDVKRLFRDKVAIFFVFIFPLIFLAIFGSIFGGNDEISFRIALINQSDTQFSQKFVEEMGKYEVFKIDAEVSNLDQAREKMNRGQLEATVILPEGFGEVQDTATYPSGEAQVLYNQNNETAGTTLASIMEGVFEEINQELIPSPTPFTVKAQSTATAGLTRFDYTFAGIMGFTLLSLGIFGPTSVFPRMKQKGILRRYKATPIKIWQFFTGNVISNAIIGLLALIIMFAAAVGFFDLNMRGSYLNLIFITTLGVTMLYGIGLAIGGWAKNENQAAPLAQLVVLPMMFLSGVFFPTFLMPETLQNITQFIPLTPVIESIRLVITENASLADLSSQLAIIGGWTVFIYIVAFRVFRWE